MSYVNYSNALWQTTAAATTAASYVNYGQPAYPPPPQANWHSFACGHQIKLEQGQPYPAICEKCGPVQYEHHTYTKCGHVHSYQRGQQIPSACPACAAEERGRVAAAAKAAEEAAAEEERLREENKDVRVWLDREVSRVREPIAA